jgi:hypothetical protein
MGRVVPAKGPGDAIQPDSPVGGALNKSGEHPERTWEKPLWRQRMMAADGWASVPPPSHAGLAQVLRMPANVGLHNRYQLAYTWAVFSKSEYARG